MSSPQPIYKKQIVEKIIQKATFKKLSTAKLKLGFTSRYASTQTTAELYEKGSLPVKAGGRNKINLFLYRSGKLPTDNWIVWWELEADVRKMLFLTKPGNNNFALECGETLEENKSNMLDWKNGCNWKSSKMSRVTIGQHLLLSRGSQRMMEFSEATWSTEIDDLLYKACMRWPGHGKLRPSLLYCEFI